MGGSPLSSALLPMMLIALPLCAGAFGMVIPSPRLQGRWHTVAGIVTGAAGLGLASRVFTAGPLASAGGFFYVDALGALLIAVISVVGAAAVAYSAAHMAREVEEGAMPPARLRFYYPLLQVFLASMFLVAVVNSLGVLWVAVEATTLASALLVGFYNTKTAMEAAWKYTILCSVGIALALLGTIFLYVAGMHRLGEGAAALDWTSLMAAARHLDPRTVKLAFILALVGYGTKAGLAPMHTWLPDAHSQAPSPISALLSGVLLNAALYGILRFHAIASGALGPAFSSRLLLIFGLLSVAVAVPFILLQKDFKRLLAYSSVEHIGLIAAAVGLGSPLAAFGAAMHLFNHAVTKSLLFMLAGNLVQKYHTREIHAVHGALRTLPVSGPLLLAGGFAITGLPPFGIFTSELTIVTAGFGAGHPWAAGLALLLLALVFAGIAYHLIHMAFGSPPAQVGREEAAPGALVALALPAVLTLLLGLYVPPALAGVFQQVARVLVG